MATLTLAISSPLGTRQKIFTFADAQAQSVLNAVTALYPGANTNDSLDKWFTATVDVMRGQVVNNLKQTASQTASSGVANIPFT